MQHENATLQQDLVYMHEKHQELAQKALTQEANTFEVRTIAFTPILSTSVSNLYRPPAYECSALRAQHLDWLCRSLYSTYGHCFVHSERC